MELIISSVFLLASSFMALAAVEVPTTIMNDGRKIPVIALGTYGSAQDIAKMRQTINWAVEAGYRHIDTASLYGNEVQIGEGIKDVIRKGLVKREDLFVVTKLWNDKHARNQVVPALRQSLARLGLDYVDLYLIHSPQSDPPNIDYLETWQGMEEAQSLGLAKSIGVSNFDIEQINRLVANSKVKPAVNQIEINPTLTQEPLVAHCQNLGIVVTAYSPFGHLVDRGNHNAPPPRVDDPTLVNIAKKYGKTTSQVVLRYLLDRGTIPLPKSTNQSRLQQNINVFDFNLTKEEVAAINKFNKNKSVFD